MSHGILFFDRTQQWPRSLALVHRLLMRARSCGCSQCQAGQDLVPVRQGAQVMCGALSRREELGCDAELPTAVQRDALLPLQVVSGAEASCNLHGL